MRCPFCSYFETKVFDSRLTHGGEQVRRRRGCMSCGERFTTYETAELNLPRLIKQDGRREAFEMAKLRRGLLYALEKRPVETEAVDAALQRIKNKLLSSGQQELPTKTLGDWVMEELGKLDQVAFIRFASVYLSFDDLNAFRQMIERLESDDALGSKSGESKSGGAVPLESQ